MESKTDVKAIKARFQSGGVSLEGGGGGRPKATVHPTLSGPMVPCKKPVLESSLSGSAAANSSSTPKPSYLKSTVSTKSAPEVREFSKSKVLASKFENASVNANEDANPPFAKSLKPKPPISSQDTEQKPLFPKPPLQKPALVVSGTDPKSTFPKPPATVATKPPWTPKPENNGSSPIPPKMPSTPKPKSTISMLRQQPDEAKDSENTVVKPFSGTKQSSFRAAHNIFTKAEEAAKEEAKKESPVPSPVPTVAQKPNFQRKPSSSSFLHTVNDDPSAPKKKPLPNIYALGSAPSKPNRPPRVKIEKFKKGLESPSEVPQLKKGGPPPPPSSHPSTQSSSDLPPTLPPRPIQPDQDDNYDDVAHVKGEMFGGNSSLQAEGSGSDEEMYEDLDDRWSAAEVKEQEKKREKEDKKRVEQEKKDQKERERKEQEARKKFKLSGSIHVIHKVKARVDSKGGKNDLSIKQGELIEVIRITDNPEGRWLARTQDGSYGYVKTELVEIDFDKLKNQSLSLSHLNHDDGDVYDDVASQEESSRGTVVVLPPPPEGDGDIYDDLEDPSLLVSPEPKPLSKSRSFFRMLKVPIDWRKSPVHDNEVPPPAQFNPEGNSDQSPTSPGEEIYDDVDAFPAPPPLSSLPQLKSKQAKGDLKSDDPKKQKKFEKEEKDFRKKFKYEGEIQVLYQITVASSKKGSGKDLVVQAGEILDVISKVDHDKLICRNKEGKFGYVSTSNIVSEDNDIYDDIGDDCIYDND